MPGFGRALLPGLNTGRIVQLTSNGRPNFKSGGITVDWNTVAFVTQPTTLPDEVVVQPGNQFLRYGQVLTKIGLTAAILLTLTNTPTGGTFTLSVTNGGITQTTAALAYNASAATIQAALRGLPNVGGTLATVTGNVGGPFTVNFDNSLGAVTMTANGAALTGAGAQPGVTVGQLAFGGNVGKYGPYDPAATDGRQNLARGECYLVNTTTLRDPASGIGSTSSDYPTVLEGGMIWRDRLIATAQGPSLAAGPTFASLEAVLPLMRYTEV